MARGYLTSGFLLLAAVCVAVAEPRGPTVSSGVNECSDLGLKLLNRGASAVDAAIATFLCESLLSFKGLAVGAGLTLQVWDEQRKVGSVLNAKEQPPAKEKTAGGKAVEVPGVVAGFWAAHQKYGSMPWAYLFVDAVDLAASPSVNNPKLSETLKKVKEQGSNVFYEGEVAQTLVREIQADGGVTTLDDFKNYTPKWETGTPLKLNRLQSRSGFSVPHVSVVTESGQSVSITSSLDSPPAATFASEATGVVLKQL